MECTQLTQSVQVSCVLPFHLWNTDTFMVNQWRWGYRLMASHMDCFAVKLMLKPPENAPFSCMEYSQADVPTFNIRLNDFTQKSLHHCGLVSCKAVRLSVVTSWVIHLSPNGRLKGSAREQPEHDGEIIPTGYTANTRDQGKNSPKVESFWNKMCAVKKTAGNMETSQTGILHSWLRRGRPCCGWLKPPEI